MKQNINEIKYKKKQSPETIIYLSAGLLIAMIFITAFNIFQIKQIVGEGSSFGFSADSKIAVNNVLPNGIPRIYGTELGVSFDDVSITDPQKADIIIKKVAALDNRIQLTSTEMQRYIPIASQISCEYCCGAEALIDRNGRAACGCAHSYAMRGLAKYLIQNHPNDFTDDQILEEMGKWKTLFFPGALAAKAKVLESEGIELNYINLASNKYRDIEKGSASGSGGMVGGC